MTCAVTGGADTAHLNPAVPVTPQQIAQSAVDAHRAGAAIVHLHVRDPASGKQSMALPLYRETVERIREAAPGVIVNLTCGPGARWTPGTDDPRIGAPSSTLAPPEDRVAHVLALQPEICSLDVATFTFGDSSFINTPDHLRCMAALVRDAGVLAEIEVFDHGHLRLAKHLVEQGDIYAAGRGPLFQLCLGIPWGAPASTQHMLLLRDQLPSESTWSAFGISAQQFPMVAQAAILGGHVRVGLEDNLYLSRGVLAPSNAALCARAATLIDSLGFELASADEARVLLGLPARD